MSYTQTDVDRLKSALAKGALSVRVGDEQVQFRSVTEMRQILRDMERELAGATAAPRQTYPQFVTRPLA